MVVAEMAMPDPRAFAEEIDIVPQLPKNLQGALSSSKWKERKEVLDELAKVVNTPRIKDAPELGDVVKGLAGRMTDANINCVIGSAQCLEMLAKGLMSSFARYRETVVHPMLERLKERKQSVTDAIGLALDAVFLTVRHSKPHSKYDAYAMHRCRYRTSFLTSCQHSRRRIHK